MISAWVLRQAGCKCTLALQEEDYRLLRTIVLRVCRARHPGGGGGAGTVHAQVGDGLGRWYESQKNRCLAVAVGQLRIHPPSQLQG